MGFLLFLEMNIDGFASDDFSLAHGLLVEGVVKAIAIVEDDNFSFCIFADSNLSMPHGVSRSLSLDLIDDIVVMHGQVLGQGSGFLVG